ncbi:allantoate amidohydrolase [Corynebacterium sp.]|uniref:allantoate amidohydrolase n=1 Tax=Corynebacterium sp. TaxID=1720 RepID=UPI0028AE70B4|nr:allantoate amidohydrolase [Corynebacterium sp.]
MTTTITFTPSALLSEIADIGRDPVRGGYSRPVFSPPEQKLNQWFVEKATSLGLDVEQDRNGILWAWWDTPSKERTNAIGTGSHLDSVPGGGNFDGPLGVASALSAVAALKNEGFEPSRPIAILVFPEEEGSRFGLACLSSRLATGAATPEKVRNLTDPEGISYAEAAEAAGFDHSSIGADKEGLARLGQFVELHIEQGKGLIDLDKPVAIAGTILGHGRWHARITGTGDHAGTTRMQDRQDPMLVGAHIISAVREEGQSVSEARATVGRLEVTPGGTNVIASQVDLWIDVRHRDDETTKAIVERITQRAELLAKAEGCKIRIEEESFSPTVHFDNTLREKMKSVLIDAPVLDTGAGHDAGILSTHVPTGMLFVRNPSGTSHSPAEFAEAEDVDTGALRLADVLRHLSL